MIIIAFVAQLNFTCFSDRRFDEVDCTFDHQCPKNSKFCYTMRCSIGGVDKPETTNRSSDTYSFAQRAIVGAHIAAKARYNKWNPITAESAIPNFRICSQ